MIVDDRSENEAVQGDLSVDDYIASTEECIEERHSKRCKLRTTESTLDAVVDDADSENSSSAYASGHIYRDSAFTMDSQSETSFSDFQLVNSAQDQNNQSYKAALQWLFVPNLCNSNDSVYSMQDL